MKLISHRGNLYKPDSTRENQTWAIEDCITRGYVVEVDLWCDDLGDERCFLSHGIPTKKDEIDKSWLFQKQEHLLIHCKNKEAIEFAIKYLSYDWFFHDKDKYAWTKERKIICYGELKDLIEGNDVLIMMPEHHGIEPKDIKDLNIGYICTDYVE